MCEKDKRKISSIEHRKLPTTVDLMKALVNLMEHLWSKYVPLEESDLVQKCPGPSIPPGAAQEEHDISLQAGAGSEGVNSWKLL